MTLSSSAQRWVEQQTGGTVVEVEQQARWRTQHFLTLDRGGERVEVITRGARDPDVVKHSKLLSHYDLAREARVLEALQGTGVAVPEFLGFSDEHQIILMERLAGTNRLAEAPDDETRRRVMFEYYEQLARLHSLDLATMTLREIPIPTTPEDVAFAGKFRFAEDDYAAMRRTLRPEPLLDLGIWWLHANVPRGARPVSWLQGDTGPGQFMFADGHLTGLIDWELSHIADPMLDLGVARMRNMLYPAGSIREPILHYEAVSGRAIDWPVLGFYTVMTMIFTPLGVLASVQNPSAAMSDQLARYEWDVILRRGLCDALAEVLGLELEPPELPAPPEEPLGMADLGGMADFLVDQLETNCVPLARDNVERYQIDIALAVARSVQLGSKVGTALLDDDLDDMGAVLGRRPSTRADGMAELARLVDDAPDAHVVELVQLFSRIERRREFLCKPAMLDSAAAAFEPLAPR
jgi:aminoglycoside phosphotransferase (APT) family kinase protein